ncbi:MAG: DUF1127 domain-containing protein [Acetobacteraceae bacterium]
MPNVANLEASRLSLSSPARAVVPARKLAVPLSWLAPACLLGHLREYMRRQRVMDELRRLNDRELLDMRLTRDEISEIFTPEFARHRSGEGGWKEPPGSSGRDARQQRLEPEPPGHGRGVSFCTPGEIAHILRRPRNAHRSSAPRT